MMIPTLMRLARLLTPTGPVSGEYENGTLYADDGVYDVGVDGRLLPPCSPSALYCIGRNYATTLEQMDYEQPEEPDFFIKPATSLIADGQSIPYPTWTSELTYAGELVVVIDERCRNLSPEAVPSVVRGYTIMNDVDALDQVGRTARKAFDGSAPLGPWLETDVDPTDIDMETYVDDEKRQESNTEMMLFDPYELVAHLSQRFTLSPGDCIALGSPENPGVIEPGQTVAITYDGVGTLTNEVAETAFP
jgi:2-keto-4-pentenoate hydratase/2-oxohepta-3-ene-1,7-dioic acid hydratase in catechol pathway